MLTIFLFVIGLGIAAFLFVLKKEMGGGDSSALPDTSPHLRDFANQSGPSTEPALTVKAVSEKLRSMTGHSAPDLTSPSKKLQLSPAQDVVSEAEAGAAAREGLQDIKEALVKKLDQKCVKLEEILEEKNRILSRLEEDLKNEQSHRHEFEGVKEILQQQIEELKVQNKQLKEELSRSLEDNLALQTKMRDLDKTMKGHKAAPFVEAEPPSGPVLASDPIQIHPAAPIGQPPPNRPSLGEIFGKETDKK